MTRTIQTARLEIRPFSVEDTDELSDLLLNDDIKKTYMIPDFDSGEALQKMIDTFMRLSRDPGRFVRGVYLSSALIGFVNDVEIGNDRIELGYVIHPAFWNRGYATEMLGTVIRALLANRFSTVRAGAFFENTASLRVMEKCGMKRCPQTESVEYRGVPHTCIYYESTRETV